MNTPNIQPEQLRPIKCLNSFQDVERMMFLEFVEPLTCGHNTVLFEEGDTGDCMYLILEGQMRVFHRKKGQTMPLRLLESGDSFGDIALFHRTPRLASVEATHDSQLLKLTAEGLQKLTAKHPELAAKFLHSLAMSLTQMYRDFR